MAKNLTKIKKPQKAKRISTIAQNISDRHKMGSEPDVLSSFSDVEMNKVYNWYNYMTNVKEVVQYMHEYFTFAGLKSKPNEKIINKTLCYVARIKTRGGSVPEHIEQQFQAHIKLLSKKIKSKPPTEIVEVIRKDPADDIIADVDSQIDQLTTPNLYKTLQDQKFPRNKVSKIVGYYQRVLDEYKSIATTTDRQLKEGYRHLNKRGLNDHITILTAIIDDCGKYVQNKNIVRKTRVKKPVSTTSILKFIKPLKQSEQFKLSSIDPAKILDSTELFTFNVKNRVLTHYVAQNDMKLSVKRTALVNFDPDKTVGKRVGRNIEEVVQKLFTVNRQQKHQVIDEIPTKPVAISGRINEDTILLLAIK